MQTLSYLAGFHHYHQTEALKGALPTEQNSPQRCPMGLYAEQISGTAFTRYRAENLHSWLYRIKPSVGHDAFEPYPQFTWLGKIGGDLLQNPTQARWNPLPFPQEEIDFIDGQITYIQQGKSQYYRGGAVHLFAINQNMGHRCFYNADAEMLIILESGELQLKTEMGLLQVIPGEILVIPRGIKFSVDLLSERARGYTCENYGQPFRLPELGLIGANGLANPRDFLYPVAAFEEKQTPHVLITKFHGHFWQTILSESPFNVVAWHGNYAPYKYDLRRFNTINTVSFDHPDPCIFTVLTSGSEIPQTANLDFVIFPERWMVAEHTFRPPYYHRNVMSEFMGLIYGRYDAKEEGFSPGGASLHNCMSPHGPDKNAFLQATKATLKPEYYKDTLAFMLESSFIWKQSEYAQQTNLKQLNYLDCWHNLPKNFTK